MFQLRERENVKLGRQPGFKMLLVVTETGGCRDSRPAPVMFQGNFKPCHRVLEMQVYLSLKFSLSHTERYLW